MNALRLACTGALVTAALVFGGLLAQPAAALSAADQANSGAQGVSTTEQKKGNLNNTIKTVINTLLFLIGIVSVIVIIIAGITMAAGGSNPAAAKTARTSIVYAVIGVVVATLSYAIINWVMLRLK